MKREFSQQIFEKSFKYQISWKSVQGNRVVPCWRTDGHDEYYSWFSQFCKSS